MNDPDDLPETDPFARLLDSARQADRMDDDAFINEMVDRMAERVKQQLYTSLIGRLLHLPQEPIRP